MLVQVGIPVLDGKPHWATVDSLLAETVIGQEQGVHFLIEWIVGSSEIGFARDLLARRLLDMPESDCMVMVDADISWQGGDLIKLAKRPETVIGATYRPKCEGEQFNVRGPFEMVGDLYKVGGLPGGFLKISREALKQIPARKAMTSNGKLLSEYFPVGLVRDGERLGEDYGFCALCRESGVDVWLDPSIVLKHWDSRNYYTGEPRKWIDGDSSRLRAQSQ